MRDISFLVNVEHPEIRVAEVREGRLFDLDVERDGRLLGDIYYGQVENIIPGMDAAFVDIGTGRNALIYVGDVDTSPGASEKTSTLSIEKLLKTGQEIMVQIARPPVGTKGARVTARLSLPGRYTVLMASSDTVGVSRRIESAEERERLRRVVEKVRPLDHGVIVRTEAEGVSAESLAEDIQFLWKQLQHLKARAAAVRAPVMLHRDLGVLGRLARDRMGENIDRVLIDGAEEYQAFRTLVEMIAPQYADRVHLHTGPSPLFELFGVAKDIAHAVDRTIHLPNGGSLVIDEAEALTAIDVNTGKFIGKNRL
ncbi:MAG TPA: ribonuclease E/G, partial [Abditibacteriaceae bacterium]